MKRIVDHHDGLGRQERLLVLAIDEPAPAPNSSHHEYAFVQAPYPITMTTDETLTENIGQVFEWPQVGKLQFQRGPFGTPGSIPGTLSTAVLAALIDHHRGFQNGPLASRENALAITKMEEALMWLNRRARDRYERGVLGKMEK